uniref:Proopiomelanocortin a n=1 Tax=Amphiprion percula TaxID=161767 RepID=A0A3P8SRX7_AMPPE
MCPVWLLVAAAAVGVVRGAVSQCWEHPNCQEVNSELSMMECIQLYPFPLLPFPSFSSSSPQTKRSYSMEHFRWGKPVGRKRRPIKIYTTNGVEEESAELFPGEMRRRELASEMMEDKEKVAQEEQMPGDVHEKKDGTYKMKHFRWSGPPASKRYGGFMKSWDERSQRPLLTLFKNVINKDGQEEMREQ